MFQGSRISIIVVALAVVAAALAGAAGMWYVASGDTTSVLAALVEQTPTPQASATVEPTVVPVDSSTPTTKSATGAVGLGGAFGTLQAVNGSTLTIQNAKEVSQTLQLTASSELIVVGKPNATSSDLQTGDKVLALGVKKSASELMPRVVIVAPATYTQANLLAGKIDSVSGSTLSLSTRNGSESATLDSNTQVFGPKLVKADASSLTAGTNVLILGEPGASGFTAQTVITVAHARGAQDKTQKQAGKAARKQTKTTAKANRPENLPGAFGSVTAITSNSLSVQPLALRNFKLSPSTKVIMVGKPNATISDIQTGDKVLVLNGVNAIKGGGAGAVVVTPSTYTLDNTAAGKVVSVDANAVTLKTLRGTRTVNVSSATQLYGKGLATLTLQDFQVGQKVLVIGTSTGTTMDGQILFGLPLQDKAVTQ